MADLTPRRFQQVFKTIMGKTPKHYYMEMKMNLGAQLLKNTPMTVAQIAIELGFSSQFHFTKDFKEFCGKCPTELRKK